MNEQKKPIVEWLKSLADEVRGKDAVGAICQLCESTQIRAEAYPLGIELANALLVIADEVKTEQRAIIDAMQDCACSIMETYARYEDKPMKGGESIADWLARWYEGKPCDPDGEPWQLNDRCCVDGEAGLLQAMEFNICGNWYAKVLLDQGGSQFPIHMSLLKRITPSRIGADKTEIKVGDMVSDETSTDILKVTAVDDDGCVAAEDEGGNKIVTLACVLVN